MEISACLRARKAVPQLFLLPAFHTRMTDFCFCFCVCVCELTCDWSEPWSGRGSQEKHENVIFLRPSGWIFPVAARKQGASSSRLSGGLSSFRLRRDGGMERVTDVAECCWTQAGQRLIKRVIMSANQGECRSRRENKRPSELRAGPQRRTA